jgi:hypothetical protein
VDESGLTHQQLAAPLKKIVSMERVGLLGLGSKITLNGVPLEVSHVGMWAGSQSLPFPDSAGARFAGGSELTVKNTRTGKTVLVSPAVIDLIDRFGFYEGFSSPFRVEPQDLVDVFELKKNAAPRRAMDHAEVAEKLISETYTKNSDDYEFNEKALDSYSYAWSANLKNRIEELSDPQQVHRVAVALTHFYEAASKYYGADSFSGSDLLEVSQALIDSAKRHPSPSNAQALAALKQAMKVYDKESFGNLTKWDEDDFNRIVDSE